MVVLVSWQHLILMTPEHKYPYTKQTACTLNPNKL
mgnify:FL=1